MARQPHFLLDPANFWLYTSYMVLVSIVSALLVELLDKMVGSRGLASIAVTTIVCFLLIFGCWLLSLRHFRRRLTNANLTVLRIRPQQPAPAIGLIALCSMSSQQTRNKNAALEAARYHRETLEHLWLITSHSALETAQWVNEQVAGWGKHTYSPIIVDDTSEVDLIRLKVEEVRRQAIEGYKIPEAEVICDFTGMTKPMTAGMILACAPKGRRLEYVQGRYDVGGKRMDDAPSLPIEIEIQYQIEPEL